METRLKSITVHPKICCGCVRFRSSVMISFEAENDPERNIHDLFLSEEQARGLLTRLQQVIDFNDEGNDKPQT